MYDESLLKAVKYFGSQRALARVLKVSQVSVNHWLNRNKKIPYVQALKIALYTEGNITIENLSDEEKDLTFLLKHSAFLKSAPVIYIPLEKIITDGKRCPIYKDIRKTSEVTSPIHLARPVLVDRNNRLIACECRLRVYKSVTSKVKVCRLDAESLVKNSANIDSLLKNFSISERVEVGLFIEKELGNRRGKRTDLELPQNSAEVKTGDETRRLATKVAGFGSHFTYSQAKEVIKHGLPELIKAMDDGLLAVSKAKQIASLPEEAQIIFIETMNQKVTK